MNVVRVRQNVKEYESVIGRNNGQLMVGGGGGVCYIHVR